MKWFYVSLLGLSLIVSSVFLPVSSVSAASPWDDVIDITDRLEIRENYGEAQDVTTDWSSYIRDSENEDCSSFQNAVSNNGVWAVSQYTGKNNGSSKVYVWWSDSSDMYIEAAEPYGTRGYSFLVRNHLYNNAIIEHDNNGDVRVLCSSHINVFAGETGGGAAHTMRPFLSTATIEYPTDYQGEIVPDSVTIVTDLYPLVAYSVDDLDLLATYSRNLDSYIGNTYQICWRLFNESDMEQIAQLCSEHQYDRIQPFRHKFESYGTYIMVVSAHTLIPGPPIDDIVKPTTIKLNIDGSTYVGGTGVDNCEETPDGLSCEQNPYEDCSTYGADLIGGIACNLRNFGIWLKITLLSLFVPSPEFFRDFFESFRSFFSNKLGFLAWPLEFAVNFVNAFFDGLSGTNNICDWSFGNLFNGNFSLNFCSLEQNFPNAFNTVRFSIQAFTVFLLIAGLYNQYRRTLKT